MPCWRCAERDDSLSLSLPPQQLMKEQLADLLAHLELERYDDAEKLLTDLSRNEGPEAARAANY